MRTTIALCAALMLAACGGGNADEAIKVTRVDPASYEVEVITDRLSEPWDISFEPRLAEMGETAILITGKGGDVVTLMPKPGWTPKPFPDTWLPEIYFDPDGQSGLFSVAAQYVFKESPLEEATVTPTFLSYAYGDVDNNGTAICQIQLRSGASYGEDNSRECTDIFRAQPPKAGSNHFGGRMVFLPDGTLVLSLGEGFEYREEAQNLGSHLGTIVRINPDGSVPENNPFVGTDGALPEIYSYGHRNVQGLYYDAPRGILWAHEHGPKGGDELNIIAPGGNYGWPVATYGVDYIGSRISPYETYDGMIEPVHTWTPSIAPSGMTVYYGDKFPEWEGDIFVGGLASRDVRRLIMDGATVVGEESLLGELDARVRDIETGPDGYLYVLLEDKDRSLHENDGTLVRVKPRGE